MRVRKAQSAMFVFAMLGLSAEAVAQEKKAGPDFKFYGIIKTAVEGAYGAPESFGHPNFSAVTSASHPVVFNDREEVFTSFQVAQTRFGFKLSQGPVLGKIELDFIDFNKSTPTLASQPRLRVASLDWKLSEHDTLSVGQQWDLFAHIQPHHLNIVGAHFTAGNLSFMRDQIIWLHQRPKLDVGVAVGLPGANGAESLNNLERGLVPTVSARAGYKINEKSVVGVSGIGTSVRLSDEDRLTVYGAALYLSWAISPSFELRGESYFGQNLANIGQLTLGAGHKDADVREVGAWLSLKQQATQVHGFSLTAGMAQVLNTEDMLLGYTPAAGTAAATRSLGQGLGMERNIHVRLSWSANVADGLKVFTEPYVLASRFKLAAQDKGSHSANTQTYGAQAGLLYGF